MVVIDVYVLYIDTLTKVLFNYECIILSADMKRKKKCVFFFVKNSVTLPAMLINYYHKTISTRMKYDNESFIHELSSSGLFSTSFFIRYMAF